VVKSVTQFGRSRHWYLPRDKTDALEKMWLMKHSALFRRFMRRLLFLVGCPICCQ
jgi:hypothetical protein